MAVINTHQWVALALLVLLVVSVLSQALLSDALLKYEYKFCRDAWEADGSLPGLFWTVPDAADITTARMRSSRLMWRWLFSTPEWIAGVKPLERKLRWFRFLWLISTVFSIILVVYGARWS
jgi:hypothetical protein